MEDLKDPERLKFLLMKQLGLGMSFAMFRIILLTGSKIKITLLRVIPTMTFIHFLTGKSSGILSDISSDIPFGILSGISSGI